VKNCAFLTLEDRGDYVIDDEHLINPLAELGWRASTVSWRQTETPWSEFDAVIIRSTWDYWDDVPSFLNVLEQIDGETHLANSLEIARWNLEKTYLADLERKGIGIVPTIWPPEVKPESFQSFSEQLGCDQLVIKPVIGANGDKAFQASQSDSMQRREMISACFSDRRALVQRFMPSILTEGEFSLFFFNGEFSHAILKTPAESEFRCQEEHGGNIQPVVPEPRLLKRAQQVLDALPETLLYARVDFVRDDKNDFLVMELELIEPSMYLRTDPGAPMRFARAIDTRFSAVARERHHEVE
jgi:glutathione synthase/RimK-type ligase-like ATP-grasp enzyme